jgi:hypothetical protein
MKNFPGKRICLTSEVPELKLTLHLNYPKEIGITFSIQKSSVD